MADNVGNLDSYYTDAIWNSSATRLRILENKGRSAEKHDMFEEEHDESAKVVRWIKQDCHSFRFGGRVEWGGVGESS